MVRIFHLLYSIRTFSDLINFFTATEEDRLCNDDEDNVPRDIVSANFFEAIKLFANSPVPPNCIEQMFNQGSGFTFVASLLSIDSGEPFRHFLDLSIADDNKIAATYRYIKEEFSRSRGGVNLLNEEVI